MTSIFVALDVLLHHKLQKNKYFYHYKYPDYQLEDKKAPKVSITLGAFKK
jgi:hypothetical protein